MTRSNVLFLGSMLLVLAPATPALALDPGDTAPKKAVPVVPENIPVERQGGDTVADAFPIPSLPFSDAGTTAGYHDDYDVICPYGDSSAPDVVYAFMPPHDVAIDVDLCYSSFDTKVYVYDPYFHIIACNDDHYFVPPCYVYASKVENVPLQAGLTYHIVVDGFGDSYGPYIMDVDEYVPCDITCPAVGVPEDEPPLVDGYVDYWNGGCNAPGHPFYPILSDANAPGTATLCGVSGWYDDNDGVGHRDTDWFILHMGPTGSIHITLDAESPTVMFELFPQNCDAVAVVQSATAGPCLEVTMMIGGYSLGGDVWFWVGPTGFAPPYDTGNEYDYVCSFSGLEEVDAVEPTSWSRVKALFE